MKNRTAIKSSPILSVKVDKSNMEYKIKITAQNVGRTVGEILRSEGFSHRLVTSLKRCENGICLNGAQAKTIEVCNEGDVITLSKPDDTAPTPNPTLNVRTLYEDERVIVFDKPQNMPVHESIKHRGDTLSNAFAARCPGLTFRAVNRLDRDTFGCVICAKDRHAAKLLQRSYQKRYVGICHGIFAEKHGTVDAPIARERESIIIRCVSEIGQPAVTEYNVLEERNGFSLVEFSLKTGRTHQIRVHMNHIGHPIAGDSLYGGECPEYPTLRLCCAEVSFYTPDSENEITVKTQFEI